MTAWAVVAFFMEDEEKVLRLKAQNCISKLKTVYGSAGQIYGHFSKFSHWEQAIHGHFLDVTEERLALITASCRHRAMSLTLCLIVLDLFIEVTRYLYPVSSDALIVGVQGVSDRAGSRRVHQMVAQIVDFSRSDEDFQELQFLLRQ
jgi:hypothetical protein